MAPRLATVVLTLALASSAARAEPVHREGGGAEEVRADVARRRPIEDVGRNLNTHTSAHDIFLARDGEGHRIVVKTHIQGSFDNDGPVDAHDPKTIDPEAPGVKLLERYGGPRFLGEVRIRDGKGGWLPGIAMEHVDGVDLKDALAGSHRLKFQVTEQHLASLDRLFAAYARDGVLSGDLNDKNLMLTPDGRVVPIDAPSLYKASQAQIEQAHAELRGQLEELRRTQPGRLKRFGRGMVDMVLRRAR